MAWIKKNDSPKVGFLRLQGTIDAWIAIFLDHKGSWVRAPKNKKIYFLKKMEYVICSNIAQWGSALVVRGQIFQHSSNYFTIWKITKMLISEPNFNSFGFCKRTPKSHTFAYVFKHSPHWKHKTVCTVSR